ncbi:hypothetical protein [Peribacillus frigoritolerans]|uniref:hypothetical protein n=1 Tax=Peribacillus frigoritolerans TaxID=450367 RepID=UPI0024C18293|nr:hypothetical protein [Peribacillus frigoritolerans]WHX62769.1 hypothetical protein QNH33_04045 [Peribacillus frigoritolerans]
MTSLFTAKGNEIDRSKMLKADSWQELKEKLESRLKKEYKSSRLIWINKLQNIFTNYELTKDEMLAELTKMLKFTIEKKAEAYERKYKYVRLSYHDFEAELWKITYLAIDYYEEVGDIDSEFMLLETLEMFWKSRMNNFIKSCVYTKKHNPWYTASTLADDFETKHPDESVNIELQLIHQETITELFNESRLTEKERKLLEIIYEKPDESLREWGERLNINHPETVRRLYKQLKVKLAKHNPY